MTPIEALGRLEASTDIFVRAEDIVPVFEINGRHPKTETLIRQAKHPDGNPLPFKFVILGTHVYFNRLSFLEYIHGKKKSR